MRSALWQICVLFLRPSSQSMFVLWFFSLSKSFYFCVSGTMLNIAEHIKTNLIDNTWVVLSHTFYFIRGVCDPKDTDRIFELFWTTLQQSSDMLKWANEPVVSFSNLWYQPKISQLSYVYQTIPVKCVNLLIRTIDLERTTTEITEYEKHSVFRAKPHQIWLNIPGYSFSFFLITILGIVPPFFSGLPIVHHSSNMFFIKKYSGVCLHYQYHIPPAINIPVKIFHKKIFCELTV